MEGGRRLVPIVALLVLAVGGALWMSRDDGPPAETPVPEPAPARRLSPVAERVPPPLPDLPPASIEGAIRGNVV